MTAPKTVPKTAKQLRRDFYKYHRANPQVWKLLVRFAFEALDSGVRRIGISFLVERIRWEVQVVTRSTDGFKINNNHQPFYSRRLARHYPELANLFETRRQKKVAQVSESRLSTSWLGGL